MNKKYKFFQKVGNEVYGFETVEEMTKWITNNMEELPDWSMYVKEVEKVEFERNFGSDEVYAEQMKKFYEKYK